MPYELLIKLKKFSPLRKKQLLLEHSVVHAWWYRLLQGKPVINHKTKHEFTKKEIIRRHKLLVLQIFRAGMCHYWRSSLDNTLPLSLREKTKRCSGGK